MYSNQQVILSRIAEEDIPPYRVVSLDSTGMKVKLLTVVSLQIGVSTDRATKAGDRCDFVVHGPHKVRMGPTPQPMAGWVQATPASEGAVSIALTGSLAIGRTFAPAMLPNDLIDILVHPTLA
jgi:hypothetical protein